MQFGYKDYTNILSCQIEESYTSKNKPLCVGIFGEWGSGKTTLLEGIEKNFRSKDPKEQYIPIFFNAWRFEKEEHLIIPLLKTVYYEVEKLANNKETKVAQETLSKLKSFKKFIGRAAKAFIYASEFKVGIAGNEYALKGKDAIEALEKACEEEQEASQKNAPFSTYESIYYNIIDYFEQISSDGFKLLFLIDDLDRCMPENAVKLLESIKLFLDVEGCAFVLAVDDDIIERGIAHKYHVYNQNNQDNPIITGAEYLEKIITLPFKLPALCIEDVRNFYLTDGFRHLFERTKEPIHSDAHSSSAKATEEQKEINEELLGFFIRTVPRVPRRLIRTLNLYETKRAILEKKGLNYIAENHPIFLAQMVCLELFTPNLFRYGQREYPYFFTRLSSWKKEHKDLYETDEIANANENETTQRVKEVYTTLNEHLKKSKKERNGFDINAIFLDDFNQGADIDKLVLAYLQTSLCEATHSKTQTTSTKRRITIANEEEFLAQLFSPDPQTRKFAYETMREGYLPHETIQKITTKLQSGKYDTLMSERQWLTHLLDGVNEDEAIALVGESGIITRLREEQR